VISWAATNYHVHKAFPEIVGREAVLDGLTYILGRHPASNLSFVSGVGTRSKRVAYGQNRAEFTFIAGGVVPGVLVLKPDFPENQEDWPFLWGENEYVVDICAHWIFLANAVNDLLRE
jgi:endoglucanase